MRTGRVEEAEAIAKRVTQDRAARDVCVCVYEHILFDLVL